MTYPRDRIIGSRDKKKWTKKGRDIDLRVQLEVDGEDVTKGLDPVGGAVDVVALWRRQKVMQLVHRWILRIFKW